MIIATVRLVVSPEQRNDVLETGRLLLDRTRVQPGCMSCRFYQDIADPNALILLEEWRSQEDLNRHMLSEEYRSILALIDMASETPEIKFNTISHCSGMEVIQAARQRTANHQQGNRGTQA